MRLFADRALLPEGLCANVAVDIDGRGTIVRVTRNASSDRAQRVNGTLLPGMANVHSHVFQRTIAGRTQRRQPGENSFWSWREQMYRAANEIEPDGLQRLAEATFVEMLEAGYTGVAEFHYLHATPGGQRYAGITELSDRLIAAALHTGIAITLLPVLYLHGDFGGAALAPEQRRFSIGLDGYLELWHALHAAYAGVPDVRIGFAPHSLRAVTADELRFALHEVRTTDPATPVHIHIAEQEREVQACRRTFGTTPVHYLTEHVGIDARWCLVHATHANDAERAAIVAAQAVVGLCPTTEADLGDGLFPAASFLSEGGRFAIGSDSNVRIDVREELRLLEYAQRLRLQERTVLCSDAFPSVGETLYRGALAGGWGALDQPGGEIAAGARPTLLTVDDSSDDVFDELIFSGRSRARAAVELAPTPGAA